MSTKVLSFEIGTKVTKICVIKYKQKNPKIYHTIMIDTPVDCVEDGYIRDVDSLAKSINDALKKEKIRLTQAIFTISSSKIVNREVIIPYVKENKIQEIIEANATDYFPIDTKDYSLSYIIMERVDTKEIKNYRLLVLAMHSNLLMTYYNLAELLRLKITSIDYVGNSVYQLYQQEAIPEISMFVQINEQNTMINVLNKDALELQRVIPYGYDSVLNAVSENKDLHIASEDAFTALTQRTFINSSFPTQDYYYQSINSSDEVQEDNTNKEITEALRYLINNLVRVVDYYGSKKKDSRIRSIRLTGQGAYILGLDKLLSTEIGIETKILTSFHSISFDNKKAEIPLASYDFSAAVGASIAPIGLVPKKYMERVTKKNDMVSVFTISSLVVVTSLVLWFVSAQQLHDAQKDKNRLNTEINKMSSINEVYSENLDLKGKVKALDDLETLCYTNNENLLPLIKELEEKLPSAVTVHSLSANSTQLLLNLTADSKETAALTMVQLKTISILMNIRTAGITEEKDDFGITKVSFSISADYIQKQQSTEEVK